MKKFLALALALVMALALAVPAMAFTNDVAAEYEYTLGIELVEYEDKDFFGILSAAPSDRGYAKNEVVAFIVTYTAEKGGKADLYNYLKVTGNNVTFNVTDNALVGNRIAGAATVKLEKDATDDFMAASVALDSAKLAKANQTAKWLAFAKVTGDDASITAELTAANNTADSVKFTNSTLSIKDEDDKVYTILSGDNLFKVSKAGVDLFAIEVDDDDASKALYVYKDGVAAYTVVEGKDGYIFVHATQADITDATTDAWKDLNKIVEDEFEGFFGFDYDLLGGIVTEKYFEGLASYDKLEVTVEIAPWVAYVQVPDVIVVDPPKTGDATVLVGIVMAIVAAAGVVVFNKVRA